MILPHCKDKKDYPYDNDFNTSIYLFKSSLDAVQNCVLTNKVAAKGAGHT